MNLQTSIGILLALLLVGCTHQREQRVKAPIRVQTECATLTSENHIRTYVGIVEEQEATAVSFTAMGTVRRVLVAEGQSVVRGQLLAELDDTQARNMLAASEASVRQAEDALQRYGQLHEKGSMTDAQWVEVQSKVDQARSQLAIARKNLEDCRLLAPVTGIVGRRSVSAGETAMPSQPVVTLLDITTVNVLFSVPEGEVAGISTHTPTHIRVEAIGREFQGGRIEKGVQADPLTHTYPVRVHLNNKERVLLPGMVAQVGVGGSDTVSASSLFLPLTSVQRRPDGSLFVWTVGSDSTARRTSVAIGQSQGNRIKILSGIADGARVITEGYQKLSEGTKVIY